MKLVNLSFQQTAVLPEHVRFSEKFETFVVEQIVVHGDVQPRSAKVSFTG
ncbi:hypothetical protein ACKUFS_15585 [Pseudomonas cannabina]|uniref:Uncharacterized protein n=2 Tax=Pseudomonas syringae group TaxID=136849 RepID=A0A8T8C4T5_PSEYM|nr:MULTISPECIES: hypothetical protein [Pseudomonas syringae group]KPW16064.1 Unknown protein sequence [Pseudomonas cannabina pv. alisalensis]MBM0139991.1 hypothetical protein [Pseudomonas cannabina pv. alisalensis]QHE98635.1 hypothetical protein PMA4326_019945 [Pseudomonas syringae pv. maculicola str. ES4326]QQN20855.1 hypothetical protein JGS08_19925 [Pseudomonas cannabina pv. alisalensis]UBY99302.1 hypothetical protein LCG56_09495 [Pseudomonas cannabina pv. alisalensis]